MDLDAGEGISLDVDRAIHAGLMVNDLVTNSLKHAFEERGRGEVTVRLRQAGNAVELQVRDTGRSLAADLDLARAQSLGLRIVHSLARRLHATVRMENDEGARFIVTFPLAADAPVEPGAPPPPATAGIGAPRDGEPSRS